MAAGKDVPAALPDQDLARMHGMTGLQASRCVRTLLAAGGAALLGTGAAAQPIPAKEPAALNYAGPARDIAAIPPSERGLPTVRAVPFFKVDAKPFAVEGPSFDRAGNLYFCAIYSGAILRLTPDGKLSTFFNGGKMKFGGTAVHKDGRIFASDVGTGAIIAISPDGSSFETILAPSTNYIPNDIVFDDAGGFYFTDWRGTANTPTGGGYHVAPDKTVTQVLPNVSMANGIALSPDNKVLWTAEYAAERLHRTDLNAQGKVARSHVTYSFTGRGPDSMRVDADGNVYVAMTNQGRILVFNANGSPIGQILAPGRENGNFLKLTSLAFIPGTRDMLIVSWDENGPGGTMIFRARGFAKGVTLYSHR